MSWTSIHSSDSFENKARRCAAKISGASEAFWVTEAAQMKNFFPGNVHSRK